MKRLKVITTEGGYEAFEDAVDNCIKEIVESDCDIFKIDYSINILESYNDGISDSSYTAFITYIDER
jgi:hypothetical protein